MTTEPTTHVIPLSPEFRIQMLAVMISNDLQDLPARLRALNRARKANDDAAFLEAAKSLEERARTIREKFEKALAIAAGEENDHES